jgi:hypothetical protein
MGLSATHIQDGARRDRLLLLAAMAHALLTVLGAASEEVGRDAYLSGNTVKRRTQFALSSGPVWVRLHPHHA